MAVNQKETEWSPIFRILEQILFLCSCPAQLKNLRILHEAMESDLLAQQRSGISSGPEYLLDCCDAMTTVLQALDRINEELDAIADVEYNVKKEG